MPIKRGRENGKYYYQYGESGKKYFYVTGNKTSRDNAKRKAIKQQKAAHSKETGGKLPTWGMQSYREMHGGAMFRFNTQTPERMVELQAKYKGQAHPDFIDRYADILNQPPKMMGWRNSVSRSEWYPEEKAAYLRDGSPISKREIIRIAGKNWNNMDELVQLRGKGINNSAKPVITWPLKPKKKPATNTIQNGSGSFRKLLTPVPKNANIYQGKLGNQHG